MSFTSDSKQQIALKKLAGKAHTKNQAEFFNESKSSGVTISFDKVLGETVPSSSSLATFTDSTCDYNNDPTITMDSTSLLKVGMQVSGTGIPSGATVASITNSTTFELSASTTGGSVTNGTLTFSTNLYVITDNTVEYLRLPLVKLPESVEGGNVHGFAAKLPAAYESSSSNPLKGSGQFVNNKEIHSTQGVIQLVPDSFGANYEVKVFKDGDATTKGSGTQIQKLDNRNWYFDYFNGILFQQTGFPEVGSGSEENPDFIEAYVYIGKMANKKAGSLSSMWEEVSGELVPTGIIDGNTGVFAADFNIDLLDDGEVELFKITTTEREDAQDLYFELDSNGDIMPKE